MLCENGLSDRFVSQKSVCLFKRKTERVCCDEKQRGGSECVCERVRSEAVCVCV